MLTETQHAAFSGSGPEAVPQNESEPERQRAGPPAADRKQEKETMMNGLDIIRAWKDEEYRATLTEAERAALPKNPAGIVELNAADLGSVGAGGPTPAG